VKQNFSLVIDISQNNLFTVNKSTLTYHLWKPTFAKKWGDFSTNFFLELQKLFLKIIFLICI
jgi:hypothetical protein